MDQFAATLAEGVSLLAAGGLGAAALRLTQAWLEKRAQRPSVAKDAADLVNAAAVFQTHLNAAAEGIVAQLRDTIVRLEGEVEELRLAHARCEADARALEGDLNQQRQVTESLARQLRAAGIDVTDLTGVRPLIVLEATVS